MTESNGAGLVYEVPADKKLTAGRPSLLVLPNGRMLVAFDLTGPDAKTLPGKKSVDPRGNRWSQTKVFSSTDGGATWTSVATLPCRSGALFRDGGDVYLLGEASGTLQLSRSPDGGTSWSMPAEILSPGAGEPAYTPFLSAPVACDAWWVALAWRGEESGWTAIRAPKGAALTNRKLWTAGGTTGPLAAWAGAGAATGAGIPAGGVQVGYRGASSAVVPLADGHPWAGGATGCALALFSAATGRAHVAAGMLLDPAKPGFSALGGAAAPWTWVGVPGGHASFAVVDDGCTTYVAGNEAKATAGVPFPGWGRAVLEDSLRTRVVLWRATAFPEFSAAGAFCEEKPAVAPAAASDGKGKGRGAPTAAPGAFAGIRREPSLAIAGGQAWMACRCGTAESRNAGDARAVRIFSLPLGK